MANFEAGLFLLTFIGYIGLTLLRTYNVMSKGDLYDIKKVFILFILTTLSFGVSFFIFILENTTLIYGFLFKLMAWLFLVNVILFIGELFFNMANVTLDVTEAYQSKPLETKFKMNKLRF